MFVSILAALGAGLLSILVGIFLVEVLAAFAYRPLPSQGARAHPRPGVAVIVPAHNESRHLAPTLTDLKAQLQPTDRLIVVADNCSDDTAIVATDCGAQVLERNDFSRIGKGYALDRAIQSLESNPPEIVIFVDADCRISDGAIDELVSTCTKLSRPTQARYLMRAPEETDIRYQVAEFAWLTKNWIRPLGLLMLGQPCQLMGTGMAFPWDVIKSVNLASGEIVEDLKLGLDLTLAGHPPFFCPSASVYSVFPSSVEGNRTQRQRWEKGHISTIISLAPKLLVQSLARRNFGLLVLTLDLMVPPLSLLCLLLIGSLFVSSVIATAGVAAAVLLLSIANSCLFALAVLVAWSKVGRDVLPANALLLVVYYVMGKVPLYNRIFSGKSTAGWIRTDRKPSRTDKD